MNEHVDGNHGNTGLDPEGFALPAEEERTMTAKTAPIRTPATVLVAVRTRVIQTPRRMMGAVRYAPTTSQ